MEYSGTRTKFGEKRPFSKSSSSSTSSSSSSSNISPITPTPSSLKNSYQYPLRPQQQPQPQQQQQPYHHEYQQRTNDKLRNTHTRRPTLAQQQHEKTEEFSAAVSWPILLAIVPTLGAFIVGNADVWSDLIMVLLVLYYVYMWITVPWSYYEGARSRRISHYQHRGHEIDDAYDDENVRAARLSQRKRMVQEELRRHELLGLLWVIVSPAIAAYTLQYSRYVLTNHEKYMSSFNIKVFVIGASIKPLIHVMALLRERTLFLQSEMQVDETDLELLQKKMELLKDELDVLKKAMATKKDLGQVTQNITPSIQQLSKAFKNFEKKESQLKTWSEDRFTEVNKKFQDVDQFICYSVEQEQRRSIVATLMFLPIHIVFWTLKRASALLPIPNLLLNLTTTTTGSFMTPTMMSHKKRPIGQLTHTASVSAAATAAARATTAQGPLCSPQGIHPDLKRRSTSASHSTTMASFS